MWPEATKARNLENNKYFLKLLYHILIISNSYKICKKKVISVYFSKSAFFFNFIKFLEEGIFQMAIIGAIIPLNDQKPDIHK